MIVVQFEVRNIFYKRLQELIGWEKVVKSIQRDGVLYTGIMSVKSNEYRLILSVPERSQGTLSWNGGADVLHTETA